MSNILSNSVSGLLAFQQALTVTSNNVSNSSTAGYSVEKVNLSEAFGQATASGYFGSGVNVQSITREYDETLAAQVRSSQSSYSAFNTLASYAANIDNMLSSTSTGLTATLQTFTNALQTVSTAPTSTANRQVLISDANALVQQLQSYQSQLRTAGQNIEQAIGNNVNQINTIAKSIAQLNAQISAAVLGTGQTPNQLLDQRDKLVDQLSQYVSVNAVTEGNGVMNIYMGTGQALVTSSTAQTLVATPNPNDASQANIGLSDSAGNVTDVTSEISGGTLGGYLATRSQVITPTENALGQIAIGIATIMNQQQQSGMDLTGAQGTAMFSVGGVQTVPNNANTGTATVGATITNLSGLTTDDYKLTFDGAAWQLQDTTSGQPVAMTGAGTAASPFFADGMSLVVTGSPAAGDSFVVRPTAGAIDGMSVLINKPSQVAAAALGASSAATANTGTGTITTPTITSPATWTSGTYTISFTSASNYQVTDSTGAVVTSGTYLSGSPISFNGEQVTISGAPASGDTFTVGKNNSVNTGDNTNILATISAMTSNALAGGTTSLVSAANNLVSGTGVLTQQAQANASAQQSVNQAATTARSNLSGVNLDEEAAKMLQFQQAYQACAQMIQTSTTMFNSLITAISNG